MAYTINRKTNLPLIENMRLKFEEMFIFGELEQNCKRFGVSEDLIRKLIYSDRKNEKYYQNYQHCFNIEKEDIDKFSDCNIENAVSLYYFGFIIDKFISRIKL